MMIDFSSPRLMTLLVTAMAVILFWWWVRWLEDSNIYYPDRLLEGTPAAAGLTFEEVHFRSWHGKNLHGWYIPPPASPAPASPPGALTLLYCHGNGGNISHRIEKALILHNLGMAVFLFDYRGYGRSEGRPSEKGTYADTEAAYRYLTEEKRIPAERMVVYGESLGGAMAVELATRAPVRAVILEATFTSTAGMARMLFPWLPGFFVRYRYDNLAKISRLKQPILIMHSPMDEVIPFWMGQKLFSSATGEKIFVELKGGHNDSYMESGAHYPEAIRSFLETYIH